MTESRNQPMPFLMEADRAAELIVGAVGGRRRTCNFPWQTAALARLMRLIPAPLYDRLFATAAFRQ